MSVSSPVPIPGPMDAARPRPDESVSNDEAAASGDSDSGSSFEMLLPDFSSLAIGETLNKDEPVYSKVQKGRAEQNPSKVR